MHNQHSSNQLIIGAAYLYGSSPRSEEKLCFLRAAVRGGFLPLEIGLLPMEDEIIFWQAFEHALAKCDGYVLIMSDSSYTPTAFDWLEKEADCLNRHRKPALLLLENQISVSEQIRKLGFANHPNSVIEYWKMGDDLEVVASKALQSFRDKIQHTNTFIHEDVYSSPISDPNNEIHYHRSVHFQGFYYSAKQLRVKSFWLQIGLTPIFRGLTSYYPAREWKFHDAYNKAGQSFEDQAYAGSAYLHSEHLHIDLTKHKDTKDILRLRLFLGNMAPNALSNEDILLGSIHGLTSLDDANNFAYKTILVGTTGFEAEINVDIRQHVERVLNLNRKSFLTRHSKYRYENGNINPIENGQIYNAEHLAGTYRIWTEGHQAGNDVVQSKMIIKPNLETRVFNGAFNPEEAQACEIFCSKPTDGKEKLIFVMRLQSQQTGARDIISVAMMELPKDADMYKPLIGSYCSAGRGGNVLGKKHNVDSEVRGGYFVVRREDLTDPEHDFGADIIPYDNFDFKKDVQLQQMSNMLKKANHIKSRKQAKPQKGHVNEIPYVKRVKSK